MLSDISNKFRAGDVGDNRVRRCYTVIVGPPQRVVNPQIMGVVSPQNKGHGEPSK